MANPQRGPLDFLRRAFRGEELEKVLLEDTCVPDSFLQRYGIELVSWTLDKSPGKEEVGARKMSKAPLPPVLFTPCSPQLLEDHPITLERFDDDESKDRAMRFPEYDSSSDLAWSCIDVLDYIFAWARGGRIPRKRPTNAIDLMMHRGITQLILPDRLTGAWEFYNPFANGWRSQIFEYDTGADGIAHPHVMLLTSQFNVGKDGSIMRGEIDVILAAMHFRVHQRLYEDDEDDNNEEDEGNKLRFPNERRFPVLVISCVAHQRARIYYACMDRNHLVIRQSQLFNFQKKDIELLDFFATILLSHPIDERAVKGLEATLPFRSITPNYLSSSLHSARGILPQHGLVSWSPNRLHLLPQATERASSHPVSKGEKKINENTDPVEKKTS